MRNFMTAAVAALGLSALASADVYGPSAPMGPIPDSPNAVGVTGTINAVNVAHPTIVSLNSVTVEVATSHTWVGDIVLTLTAPNGDNVQLMRRPGTGGPGNSGDWLAGAYTFLPVGAPAPAVGNMFPGSYGQSSNPTSTQLVPVPDADTYAVFTGDNLNGNWLLNATDYAGDDVGTLGRFLIDITSIPEPTTIGLLALAGLAAFRRRKSD